MRQFTFKEERAKEREEVRKDALAPRAATLQSGACAENRVSAASGLSPASPVRPR